MKRKDCQHECIPLVSSDLYQAIKIKSKNCTWTYNSVPFESFFLDLFIIGGHYYLLAVWNRRYVSYN